MIFEFTSKYVENYLHSSTKNNFNQKDFFVLSMHNAQVQVPKEKGTGMYKNKLKSTNFTKTTCENNLSKFRRLEVCNRFATCTDIFNSAAAALLIGAVLIACMFACMCGRCQQRLSGSSLSSTPPLLSLASFPNGNTNNKIGVRTHTHTHKQLVFIEYLS